MRIVTAAGKVSNVTTINETEVIGFFHPEELGQIWLLSELDQSNRGLVKARSFCFLIF